MKGFTQGLCAWFNGWKFILRHRQLFLVSLIPFAISLLVLVGSLSLVMLYFPGAFTQWTAQLKVMLSGYGLSFIYHVILALALLLVTVILLYVCYVLHALLASPFYSLLAERTLQLAGRRIDNLTGWSEWFAHSAAMIRVSLLKGMILAVLGVFLIIFSFVPVLNFFAAIATLLLLAYDCMDYSLEAKRLKLRARVGYVLRHKAQWAGIAMGLALTLFIPGFTLLVIPGAVAGAALIMKDSNES